MIFMRACKRRELKKAEAARAAEAKATAEQAKSLVDDAQRTYQEALELNKQASKIDRDIRDEMQRNRWTDTLFGVIQTGRQ